VIAAIANADSKTRPVALVTGIAGFCGSHLAEWLLGWGQQVAGIEVEDAPLANLSSILDRIGLRWADIQDPGQVRRAVSELRPDRIYHLAALTKTGADGDHHALYETNVYGTINLLEAVLAEKPECAVLIAGSSAQYGLGLPGENPIGEAQPARPITHYAVSKATQDLIAYHYWAAKGLKVVRTRAFNIIGPRQSPNLVASAFAKQVAEIEQGLREPVLEVGSLEAQRDFVDVRDVVRAYQLALEQGEPGEAYNVCSGQARSVRSMLEGLLTLSTVKGIEIRHDPARMQAADVPIQLGDYDKLERRTGWRPEIPFEQSLHDLLDYWRERCRREPAWIG
jgi:GDP-4-dehydro-6-deoxy-D-mannose reductase